MICTRCFCDDGIDGTSGGEPAAVIEILCKQWLCSSCLDAEETEGGATDGATDRESEVKK